MPSGRTVTAWPAELRMAARRQLRAAARLAWEAAVRRADPRAAVRGAVTCHDGVLEVGGRRAALPSAGRLVVLAIGKAAPAMVAGLADVLPDVEVSGLAVTKDEHARTASLPERWARVRLEEGPHPVPDARAPALGSALLAEARALGADDLAIVLVSGGGSALVACPVAGLELEDLQAVSEALLRSGADIHEMNVVRRHLSAVHGGRLAEALGDCPSITLAISDVPGDEPASIASGPTTPDPTRWSDVATVLRERLGSRVPPRLAALLERAREGHAPDTPSALPSHHSVHVVLGNRDATAAAAHVLERAGFPVARTERPCLGPADAEAGALVGGLLAKAPDGSGGRLGAVRGGEVSVHVTGEGRGGRNQHFAACAARELDSLRVRGDLAEREVVVAGFGTDGTDGTTAAAGGVVDTETWDRARRAGVEPEAALAGFDSHALLAASGDLVVTGPTGTNVSDVYLGVSRLLRPS